MNNFQNHNQNQNATQTQGNRQPNFNAQNQQTSPQPSGLMQIVGAVLPTLLEHFTGQKITPNSSGANGMETQLILSQVLTLQQQIVTSQQELTRRVINLENRASQQFTGLFQQVKNLKGIRLTHDREHKQIELSGNGNFQHQQEN